MMTTVPTHLVLIQTSGNQRYIFSSNKLRENVGASELTYQIGTTAIEEAIKRIDKRKFTVSEVSNEPILGTVIEGQPTNTEVIVASSGKALILASNYEIAHSIVRFVTTKALKEMPGLSVQGAIVEVNNDLTDIHCAVERVHRKHEELRFQLPNTQQRFQRLPFAEPCVTSGLPASSMYEQANLRSKARNLRPHSQLSVSKQEVSEKGFERMREITAPADSGVRLMDSVYKLEQTFANTNWLAVVHADANGLGEIFLRFNEYLGLDLNADDRKTFKNKEDSREYIDAYRKFSSALDLCTKYAAREAIRKFQTYYREDYKRNNPGSDTIELPFVPLIIGGDDLTVVCDGSYALKFTRDFLEEFERQTNNTDILDGIVPTVAQNAFGVPRLGACAGVAIVKPHYPFHQAYDLAASLIKSAKQVKTKIKHVHNNAEVALPCSAIDFHVLYDSSGVDLADIRQKLIVDEGKTRLYAKPYVVSNLEQNVVNRVWMLNRVWDELERRVSILIAGDKDDPSKRALPNSQLHKIRETLFRGKEVADSIVRPLVGRFSDKGFQSLLCGTQKGSENGDEKDSLFFGERLDVTGRTVDGHITHFLDAFEVVEFWKGCNSQGPRRSDEEVTE